jgi:nitric oxide reductase subunit B
MNIIKWVDQRKHWWKVFLLIFGVSVAVVGYIGYNTYKFKPPQSNFVDEKGAIVFSKEDIENGQVAFKHSGLMDYGTYLGDGGLRGPDFTAEALHMIALYMTTWYEDNGKIPNDANRDTIIAALVQKELKQNRFVPDPSDPEDVDKGKVVLTPAQVYAYSELRQYYREKFTGGGPRTRDVYVKEFGDLAKGRDEAYRGKNALVEQDIDNMTAFFYRGAWIASAVRPGNTYSYTHNWPYDPLAGNLPHGGLVLWSVIGTLVVILTLGVIFYFYGKMDRESVLEAQRAKMPPLATTDLVDHFRPTPTQRATYKYFAVAAILFAIQVCAGLLAIGDFVNLFAYVGLDSVIKNLLPVPITRAWHTQISVLWVAVCWFAATIWVLPLICRPEPSGQLKWVNTLFWMLALVAVGGAAGIPLGVHGVVKDSDVREWMLNQGWEFMQIGKAYQYILYAAFVVWLVIVARGVWPALKQKQTWSLPNWMIYSIVGIIFMFSAGFVAGPKTDFVIGDFWRWCTIHMWVEAFFELFTTIIVAYFLYLMGFVSHAVAARVVYLGAVLFLGSGLIGISHNFYWNAKSIETVALGGVLSSLQVAPLVLLTVEAWRFRHMPESTIHQLRQQSGTSATFGLTEAFLFLCGVNFWNFLGAGVLGFMINLPIINYYQHGTYLTINHAHAALFGVYGNLAIAAMLFCGRWLVGAERWAPKTLRFSFWAMNLGIVLMVVLDLFPVGVHQLVEVMTKGYAFGRSQAYLYGSTFQMYTWLRGFGVAFFICGMFPLVWFVVSRWFSLKRAQTPEEQFVIPESVLAVAGPLSAAPGAERHEMQSA